MFYYFKKTRTAKRISGSCCKSANSNLTKQLRRQQQVSSSVTNFLEGRLAERSSVHGVLLDVFGIGLLITGESGVGKSETALELVQKDTVLLRMTE